MCQTTRTRIDRILAVAVFCAFLGAGQSVRADLSPVDPRYAITITAVPGTGSGNAYDGQWVFDVALSADRSTVTFTVVSGNNASKTATYRGVSYTFPVTGVDMPEMGDYSFGGTSLSTPARGRYNLGLSGYFNPSANILSLNNPVTSQLTKMDGTPIGQVYEFRWSGITYLPEPSTSVLVLAALGILGTGSGLRESRRRWHVDPSRGRGGRA